MTDPLRPALVNALSALKGIASDRTVATITNARAVAGAAASRAERALAAPPPPRIDPERLEREIARWHRADDADTHGVTLAQFIVRILASDEGSAT